MLKLYLLIMVKYCCGLGITDKPNIFLFLKQSIVMTIRFFIFVFINILSFPIFSQKNHIGIHWIGNFSTFEEQATPTIGGGIFDYKIGAGIGVRAVREFGSRIGVGVELNVDPKGVKYNMYITDINGNVIANEAFNNLHYLSMPLVVNYKFGRKIKPVIHVGIAFHYLYGQSIKIDGEKDSSPSFLFPFSEKEKTVEEMFRFDQSVLGGVGIYFPLSNGMALYFDGRYMTGLNETSLREHPLFGKNRTFSFITGVEF